MSDLVLKTWVELQTRLESGLQALRGDEEGQGMVEYALILVAVALVVLVGLNLLGTNANTLFNGIANKLASVTPA